MPPSWLDSLRAGLAHPPPHLTPQEQRTWHSAAISVLSQALVLSRIEAGDDDALPLLEPHLTALQAAWGLVGDTFSGPVGLPAVPTRAWCLRPPNRVRWVGTVEVQPRLWHLLGLLLDHHPDPVSHDDIDEALYSGHGVSSSRISKDVSQLNASLLDVGFPWTYCTTGGHVCRPED